MKPLTEDDLTLYYYGEAEDREAIAKALEESPELAASYRRLCAVLDAIPDVEVPEPDYDYPARVWRRLEPEIEQPDGRRRWPSWLFDRRWALAAAAMLLVIVSFVAGRFSSEPPAETPRTEPAQKILLVTVASHLERSEMLLLELTNAQADPESAEEDSGMDVSAERSLARELNGANRLYKQAARKAGEPRVASLLDDLERLLVEVAHAPDELQADRLEELQSRLEEADLLFKVRVVGSRLRQLTDTHNRPAETDAASDLDNSQNT